MKKLLLLLFLIPNLVMGVSPRWINQCNSLVYEAKNEYAAKKIDDICLRSYYKSTAKGTEYSCMSIATKFSTDYAAKKYYADCLKK